MSFRATGWVRYWLRMVDPNVLENCGIDSKVYTGYALHGIERITNPKYQVKDCACSENDLLLEQFRRHID